MAHTVDPTAGLRTHIRAQLVSLRLQALTLAALVQRGVLTPDEAAAHVREAARQLPSESNDPAIENIYAESLETIAKDLQAILD